MPRDENNIGRSEHTPLKHQHYRELLETHTAIVNYILRKQENNGNLWAWDGYLYFDINAGDGGTEDDPGSPRIFKSAVQRAAESLDRPLPYHAVIIDSHPENANKLSALFSGDSNVTVEHGDHNDKMQKYLKRCPVPKRPTQVYGALFHDPNGTPNWDILKAFSAVYKMVDLIVYLSATSYKRAQCAFNWPDLRQQLLDTGKKVWVVRDVELYGGKMQYTFAVGSNWKAYPELTRCGFHRVDTPKGEDILRKITMTGAQYKAWERKESGQLALPFDSAPPYRTYDEYLRHPTYRAIRQQAVDRSGGICERCKRNPVTEVHHLKYPKWGTFEKNADDLQAICHDCHCEIHGKDD